MPTVSHVVRVVEAQLKAGRLQCLEPGCGGVLRPWWYGVPREIAGLDGAAERVRPRRAVCGSCGTTRVLLPDRMLRRRQYSVEVIGMALLLAAAGMPWTRVAARVGVPFETVRGWLRRFTRRADLVRAWLLGLLDVLVDDPALPAGEARPAAGALSVLAALHRQMPARWPLVASLSPWQLAARLSRGGPAGPRLAAGDDQRELTGDVAAGRAPPLLAGTGPGRTGLTARRSQVSFIDDQDAARRARAQDVALFRYRLIAPAIEPGLTGRQRGRLVRGIAATVHAGPSGRPVQVSRKSLDRWIRAWRAGGFQALCPSPRQVQPRTEAAVLELAAALKKENPERTAAQVARVIAAHGGWAPSERTLQRHFVREEIGTAPGRGGARPV